MFRVEALRHLAVGGIRETFRNLVYATLDFGPEQGLHHEIEICLNDYVEESLGSIGRLVEMQFYAEAERGSVILEFQQVVRASLGHSHTYAETLYGGVDAVGIRCHTFPFVLRKHIYDVSQVRHCHIELIRSLGNQSLFAFVGCHK